MPLRNREARRKYERERRQRKRAEARAEREKLKVYLAKRQKPEPDWWPLARKLKYKSVRIKGGGRNAVRKVRRPNKEIAAVVGKSPYAVLMALNPTKRKARLRRARERGDNKKYWFLRKLRDASTELPKYQRLSKQERDARNAQYAKRRANPGGNDALSCNS